MSTKSLSNTTKRAIHKVKNILRAGGRLMLMHTTDPGIKRWYVLPDKRSPIRGFECDDYIADLVIREPDVRANNDGLFGTSQTYGIVS